MNKKMFIILVLTIIMLCVFACGKTDNKEQSSVNNTSNISNTQSANLSGTVPDELEYIPDGYENPATQQGTLNKLTYDTCCLLYTSPSPRDRTRSRMPSSA